MVFPYTLFITPFIMPLTILNTTIPDYPERNTEPCYLFCCNFLLHREDKNDKTYHISDKLTPKEFLIDTIQRVQLHRIPKGSSIHPGDLILISLYSPTVENIQHALIALEEDIWFSTNHSHFISHIKHWPSNEMLNERDAIAPWMLHADMRQYSIGKYKFNVWRK